MPRKAVLSGGKRDEIVRTAMEMFFSLGYEATSIRAIAQSVNGEIGMLYHYFRSKEELFQAAVERFFAEYQQSFIELTRICSTKEEFLERFLIFYGNSMQKFSSVSGNMHWTIRCALAAKTIEALQPAVAALIRNWGCKREIPVEVAAGQLLLALSATLHAEGFDALPQEEQLRRLTELADRLC